MLYCGFSLADDLNKYTLLEYPVQNPELAVAVILPTTPSGNFSLCNTLISSLNSMPLCSFRDF